MNHVSSFVKVGLAILLFLCMGNMPYGYYELVRFVSTVSFIYLAYSYFNAGSTNLGITFVVLAALFQPFFKVALGRELWSVVDVVVAIYLICLLIKSHKYEKK